MTDKPLTYADAGVDIEAGAALVDAIAPVAAATARPGAETALGGFGAVFDLKAAGFVDPVLVAGTDGVGTKLEIAAAVGAHRGLGIDLVAMCVNDVLAQGAEPLFFLDYIATGRIAEADLVQLVQGVGDGCKQAGCALIGGETAEMPGLYPPGRYDVAGFCVGGVERGGVLPHTHAMAAGDALIAMASTGPHSNGYSLVRRIVEAAGLGWDAPAPWARDQSLGAALLEPTRIYVASLIPLIRSGRIKGLAHITGGGLVDNPPRMAPSHLTPQIDWTSWTWPQVFTWLAQTGRVELAEMRRTFNCGVGMVACVAQDDVEAVLAHLTEAGETAWVCGALVDRA